MKVKICPPPHPVLPLRIVGAAKNQRRREKIATGTLGIKEI